MFSQRALCACAIFTLACTKTYADPIELSGFATFGATYTDSDQLAFRSDVSVDDGETKQIDFGSLSRIGIQVDKRFNEDWSVTGQWVLKRHVDYSLDQLTQLAFVSYSPTPNWTVKAGRTAFDLFMMSPYRNIGYAYTETHAPVEFYGLIPHQNIDGIEISSSHGFAQGNFRTRLYAGKTKNYLSNFEYEWELELKDVLGATLSYEFNNWLLRTNYTEAEIGGQPVDDYYPLLQGAQLVPPQIWPEVLEVALDTNPIGTKLKYANVGLKYDNGQYYAQSELAYIDANSALLNDLVNGYAHVGKRWDTYSLQLGYSFTDGKAYETPEPRVRTQFTDLIFQGLDRALNYYVNDQSTISISGRYDFRADMAAKLQVEFVDLELEDNQFMLRTQSTAGKESLVVISATLDWVF
ncbi:hypothetical protein AAEU32_02795 [Pseudoalteromonas sp. SSDWG2]|uniref:hypothetical protein n=1 Tax=Pseudoalteromonas sp. SSDWG2 TaxID=3139391 RepID=UPI003BABDE23